MLLYAQSYPGNKIDIVHFCLTVWIISYVDSYRNTDSHVTD